MGCSCHDFSGRLMNLEQILVLMNQAYNEQNPLSLSRFGHGEITYASWPNSGFADGFEVHRRYAGVDSPLEEIREAIREAMQKADIVGVLTTNDWESAGFDSVTCDVFHELNYIPNHVCSAWIRHWMVQPDSPFLEWIRDKQVILVGRRAIEAVKVCEMLGMIIIDAVNLDGYKDINNVQQKLIDDKRWNIALISAGVPAAILAPRLAQASGRIAIDFGHALDLLIDGSNFDYGALLRDLDSKKSK